MSDKIRALILDVDSANKRGITVCSVPTPVLYRQELEREKTAPIKGIAWGVLGGVIVWGCIWSIVWAVRLASRYL